MALIAPVNLQYNVRTLWFDPGDIQLEAGNKVVVETARGMELGVVAGDLFDVTEKEIKKLKSPLKPVLRVATDEDLERADEMEQLSRDAMPVFRELARETSEDMHPVSVEYLLDGDKAVFYFEAEERIDFRDLVRKLASRFHVRIDMRQIGVRDEARIIGGLAHCGQEVCCKRLGGEFNPVSIRMAKDQDLSLNPQKISGLCGRLMCCLRYENEAYKDFKARAPKIGAIVKTPDGSAKVVEYDVPKEVILLKVEDEEKPVKVPLSDFESAPDGERPVEVGEEAWLEASQRPEIVFGASYQTAQFTGTDTLATGGAIHHNRSKRPGAGSSSSKAKEGSKGEGKRSSGSRAQKGDAHADEPARKARRRRSTTISGGKQADQEAAAATDRDRGQSEKKAVRPGQRSSGLSAGRKQDQAKGRSSQKQPSKQKGEGPDAEAKPEASKPKRRRRRSHKPQSSAGANASQGKTE